MEDQLLGFSMLELGYLWLFNVMQPSCKTNMFFSLKGVDSKIVNLLFNSKQWSFDIFESWFIKKRCVLFLEIQCKVHILWKVMCIWGKLGNILNFVVIIKVIHKVKWLRGDFGIITHQMCNWEFNFTKWNY